MSSDKLQQAIALIKSGDKKGGQNLLVDIVNSDQKNETAWLWLASVVSQDKRAFCLEKALSINPNNLQAKQYLEKLKTSVSTPQTSVSSKESMPNIMEQPMSSSPQYWMIPFGKNLVDIIILEATKLITFHVIPMKVSSILEQLSFGSVTKEWYEKNIMSGSKYKSINLNQILRTRLLLNDITIYYRDSTMQELSTTISCRENKNSDAIIESLHARLGNQFARTSKQNSRLEVAKRSLVSLLIISSVAGFGYWMAIEAVGVDLSGHHRGGGIVMLLQLIGPNGMLCIGSGLVILMLLSIISDFIKPPMETLLVKKNSAFLS